MKSETKSIQGVRTPGKQPTENEGEGTYYRILKACALGITEVGKFCHPLSARWGDLGKSVVIRLKVREQRANGLGPHPCRRRTARTAEQRQMDVQCECCFPPPFCSSQSSAGSMVPTPPGSALCLSQLSSSRADLIQKQPSRHTQK